MYLCVKRDIVELVIVREGQRSSKMWSGCYDQVQVWWLERGG